MNVYVYVEGLFVAIVQCSTCVNVLAAFMSTYTCILTVIILLC